jgi:hypothetical protein
MVTVDQLEVLLRTIPQYFLFAGVSLYIFSWMDKKARLALAAEFVFVLIGIVSFIVLLSGMIPSPYADGIVEDHIKRVTNMLILFSVLGLLSVASICLRLIWKKVVKVLVVVIFALSLVIFFQSTGLSKIDFQLNPMEIEQTENGSSDDQHN